MAVQYTFEVTFLDASNLQVNWNDNDTFSIASISGLTTTQRIIDGTDLMQQCVQLSRKHKVSKIELVKVP